MPEVKRPRRRRPALGGAADEGSGAADTSAAAAIGRWGWSGKACSEALRKSGAAGPRSRTRIRLIRPKARRVEPGDRMVRSRLEAHPHLAAIASEQTVIAILPPVRQESPPCAGSTGRKVRWRDVFDPTTEQILGFIVEHGLDPAPDRDVAMVIVGHEQERPRLAVELFLIPEPRGDHRDPSRSEPRVIDPGDLPSTLRVAPRGQRLGHRRRLQEGSNQACGMSRLAFAIDRGTSMRPTSSDATPRAVRAGRARADP